MGFLNLGSGWPYGLSRRETAGGSCLTFKKKKKKGGRKKGRNGGREGGRKEGGGREKLEDKKLWENKQKIRCIFLERMKAKQHLTSRPPHSTVGICHSKLTRDGEVVHIHFCGSYLLHHLASSAHCQ